MFVCFNRAYSGSDKTIYNFVLDAFRCAQRKSKVFGSFYKFDDTDFARDLRDIAGKDSALELKFDFVGGNAEDSVRSDVSSALDDLRGYAKMFRTDPDGLMNHNKFFVFEEMDFGELRRMHPDKCISSVPSGVAPALYLSSANLTDGSLAKHNNANLVPINREICDLLQDYLKDLKGEYKKTTGISSWFAGNKVEDRYETAKSDRSKIYLYPRRKESKPSEFVDTLVGVLKNVEHFNHRISDKPCRIHIAVAGWYETRIELAQTLAILSAHYADVKVIARPTTNDDAGINMDRAIYDALDGRAEMYFQSAGRNIHSKYMLIDAPYKSGDTYEQQKLVWTGSPNYSGHAIYHHWEMICKLYEKTGAYDAYMDDFNDLIASGTAILES